MRVSTFSQPSVQFGQQISAELENEHSQIVFVSAFASLRTILRLRERLLKKTTNGTDLTFTFGIDLGGTSKEVLCEVARWNCKTMIFHNLVPRATFHPKFFLFKSEEYATLFLGSNNLTDGGFFTNYETTTKYEFALPADQQEFERIIEPLLGFFAPENDAIRSLNVELIEVLVNLGIVPSEIESRRRRRQPRQRDVDNRPEHPFNPLSTPYAPLLEAKIRSEESLPQETGGKNEENEEIEGRRPNGNLVWQKTLSRSDALQVTENSNPVGGVRLTQARFQDLAGTRINQTTYFRQIFAEFVWEHELGKHNNQEHTFIPMRIHIRENDFGIWNFEISHKPSGEAGQANYTTILRWGRDFSPTVREENLAGLVFSLFETGDEHAPFFIEIA